MPVNRDQNDILAENDRLTAQAREFRILLIQSGGETVEAPKLEGSDLITRNEVLRTHNDDVVRRLAAHLLARNPQAKSIDHIEAIVELNRSLQTELGAARAALTERDSTIKAMTEKYHDFDEALARRTAEEVARLGISTSAIRQPKAGAAVVPGLDGATQQTDASGKPVARNYTDEVLQHQADHGKTPIKRK
ncbi:MAG TPA: hypothetical protein VH595_02795 [Verrucomicrobiae bacterium]|jgi:hypothetical protein|nr:hypothetical protein [Verrucomicrobiae bacterium]